jgi:hypothetical protein
MVFVMPSPCNTFLMEGNGRCILARGCKFRNETGDFFENILWMSWLLNPRLSRLLNSANPAHTRKEGNM